MDKLKAMTVFIAVAEEQGFVSAARRLRMSAPAVTRIISELEKHLGVVLLLRTTRQVRLTEAGHQYLQDTRRILSEIDHVEASVTGLHGDPSGHLVITAPTMFGRLYVTPVITEFLERYDNVTVSAVFVDRITHLIEEGIDVGVRIGALPDSSLRAIPLGTITLKTYASPLFLKRFGRPGKPQELLNHRLIASSAGDWGAAWRYVQNGNEVSLKITPKLTTTTNDSALAAAAAGYGITRVLSYQAAPLVAEGKLLPILEDFEGEPFPVSLVHPQGRNVPAKVRAFMDVAIRLLRPQVAQINIGRG